MESASITRQSKVNEATEESVGQLFTKGTVAALPIGVYLDWASSGPGTYSRDLAMPPIQRGFVWKARQIQDIWDSLLRGMPIGAVMVKGFYAGQLGGEVASQRVLSPSLQAGYHLIDGQQRTLSMLLGFPQESPAEHKLWVDFSAPGVKGYAFRLRVSTPAQPFGLQLDGSRLSTGERDKAYRKWKNENEGVGFDRIFDNSKPWKADSANQAALFEIKQLWKMLDDNGQDLALWAGQVEKTIEEGGGALTPQVMATIAAFGQALVQLQSQSLALIKIPHVKMSEAGQDNEDDGEDFLTMLFTRIAAGGTQLGTEDLLFSMVKHHWPDAHRLVYEAQQEVGTLMKPTDFVMTAYRMAALFSTEAIADEPRPKAASFHRHLARLQADTSSPQSLHTLVVEGLLARHFGHLRERLAYQGGEDYGLPQAMLAYLDVPLLQVLIYWLLKSPAGQFELSERHDLVRFVLYWRTCCGDASSRQDASKRAIAFLARHDDAEAFPGVALYRLLSHAREGSVPLFCELVAPPENVGCSARLLHPHARAQAYFGVSSTLYKRFCAKPQLLIWFQRAWMQAQCCPDGEFPWFKPLAGQDGDSVPYDFDHLVPQSNWSDLRGVDRKGDKEDIKTFDTLESRRALGNSIGNYRVFTATGNRSRGNKSIEALFAQEPPGAMSSQNWQFFAFDDNPANRKAWGEASPTKDPYVWHSDRMVTFQQVVEARALMLYRRLYQEAGFAAWELASPEFPVISSAM